MKVFIFPFLPIKGPQAPVLTGFCFARRSGESCWTLATAGLVEPSKIGPRLSPPERSAAHGLRLR